MRLDNLPFNLFDVALLGILVAGILRGRKHGMSEELLSLVKWLTAVLVCGLFYEPIGQWLANNSPFSLYTCYLMVYIGGVLLVLSLFGLFRYSIGGKLIGSDVFGRAEYYLGMGSGLVRFSCILLAALSILNARYYPPSEVRAMERYQDDVYGSNFFPTWHTVQETVFERSLSGPWIRDHVSFLLIRPTLPEVKEFHQQEAVLP